MSASVHEGSQALRCTHCKQIIRNPKTGETDPLSEEALALHLDSLLHDFSMLRNICRLHCIVQTATIHHEDGTPLGIITLHDNQYYLQRTTPKKETRP